MCCVDYDRGSPLAVQGQVIANTADAPLHQLFRRHREPEFDDEYRTDDLAQLNMRCREAYYFANRRMPQKDVLYSQGRDFLPAAVHDLFAAAHEPQPQTAESIGLKQALIARSKPHPVAISSADKRGHIWVARLPVSELITRCHAVAGDRYLADRARWRTFFIIDAHNSDTRSGCKANTR